MGCDVVERTFWYPVGTGSHLARHPARAAGTGIRPTGPRVHTAWRYGDPVTEPLSSHARIRAPLRELVTQNELDLADLIENGWVRDAERNGRAVVDSRAWALIVAFLELAHSAVDHAERTTWKMLWDVRAAAEKSRPSTREGFRDQFLTSLGAKWPRTNWSARKTSWSAR